MARIAAALAQERMARELKLFSSAMKRFSKELHRDLAEVVAKSAYDLEGRIKERTPVDTGRARASWHTVLFGMPATYTYQARAIGKRELARVRAQARSVGVKPPRVAMVTYDGTLDAYPSDDLHAIVGSNVEYMLVLEAGHSSFAPAGMVRVSLVEMRQLFRADIKLAVEKRRRLERGQ